MHTLHIDSKQITLVGETDYYVIKFPCAIKKFVVSIYGTDSRKPKVYKVRTLGEAVEIAGTH